MEILSWSFSFWFTAICLTLLLMFAILIMWRTRDWKAGLRLFMLYSIYVVLMISFTWFMANNLPAPVQKFMFGFFSGGSFVFLCGTGILYWINANKAGRPQEIRVDEMARLITIGGWVFLGLAMAVFLITKYDLFNVSVLWSILLAGTLLGKTFLSFQLRERGIVSRGKFIKFEDITSMRWVNGWSKEEVEYTLKDSPRVRRLKIPWNFITPIGNFISTHFPCT